MANDIVLRIQAISIAFGLPVDRISKIELERIPSLRAWNALVIAKVIAHNDTPGQINPWPETFWNSKPLENRFSRLWRNPRTNAEPMLAATVKDDFITVDCYCIRDGLRITIFKIIFTLQYGWILHHENTQMLSEVMEELFVLRRINMLLEGEVRRDIGEGYPSSTLLKLLYE